ncbi:hypothetical protein [Comamonas terrigena]|uniref:hypothetical protein n=1 Tax=Comamonas terrigena TaxID=32013 RepID=UPI0028B0C7AF|nr:hypothetical protein [Comamonas terrigena]
MCELLSEQAALRWGCHGIACGHMAQAGSAGGYQLHKGLRIHVDAVFYRSVKARDGQHTRIALNGPGAGGGAFRRGGIKAQHVAVVLQVLALHDSIKHRLVNLCCGHQGGAMGQGNSIRIVSRLPIAAGLSDAGQHLTANLCAFGLPH